MSLSVLTVVRSQPHHSKGGFEESTWKLTRAIAGRGVDETLVTASPDGERRVSEKDRVTIHEIPCIPRFLRGRPAYYWDHLFGRAAARYAKAARWDPDIIHSHSYFADGFLRWERRPPVVLTVHGTHYHHDYLGGAKQQLMLAKGRFHPRRMLQRAWVSYLSSKERHQLARADAIVPVSRVAAAWMHDLGVPRDDPRVRIIPNGIDPEDFPFVERAEARRRLGLPSEVPIVLFVGRVEFGKGVDHLLRVLDVTSDALLVVAGGGGYLETFKARVAAHPRGDRVRVLGRVPDEDRPFLYAAADLTCLPSVAESFGLVLAESIVMGTPAAAMLPTLDADLLRFCAIDRDPEAMIRKGIGLIGRFDARELRRAVLSRYTWDRIAEEYEALFESLAKESGRPDDPRHAGPAPVPADGP